MFALRGAMVSFGFLGVAYCILSLTVVCAWRGWNKLRPGSDPGPVRVLFLLRIFPLVGAVLVTLFLAAPAFFLLESDVIDEDYGTLLFAGGTLLIVAGGLLRMLAARTNASRIVGKWMEGARPLRLIAVTPVIQTRTGLPPLVLVGIYKPRVLISDTAIAVLTDEELGAAIRHEIEHKRSRDNLKKMIFHSLPFPGMRELEQAWQQAAEFAADRAAVSSPAEALDLATALVKLCDVVSEQALPAFTTGLMDVSGLVKERIQRLVGWNESDAKSIQHLLYYVLPPGMILSLCVAANYGRLLLVTHRVTEWFIR